MTGRTIGESIPSAATGLVTRVGDLVAYGVAAMRRHGTITE